MKPFVFVLIWVVLLTGCRTLQSVSANSNARQVSQTPGLIAFWDFSRTDENSHWISVYDQSTSSKSYPILLRQIGDTMRYTPQAWPYNGHATSRLEFDTTGPFGHAVRFNQGYIFAEVPRHLFDKGPLDIHGDRSFTLMAWCKFVGKRHFVAGIWDEGGWDKYGGRRQYALFGGLFQSDGVIGHISTTGAASYPQSNAPGAQYARARAIDGGSFSDEEWVHMTMTFDSQTKLLKVYQNGIATSSFVTDPVENDVFHYRDSVSSNPYRFNWPIFAPRNFTIKYNGYDVEHNGVYEHWIKVDIDRSVVQYERNEKQGNEAGKYWIGYDIIRNGASILEKELKFEAVGGASTPWKSKVPVQAGDQIVTHLLKETTSGNTAQVGSTITYTVRTGAPFTFGRALGLGDEPVEEGTQLFIDGVAVFDRVLTSGEIRKLSFSQ